LSPKTNSTTPTTRKAKESDLFMAGLG
jgi:hypothetical protein